MAETSPPRRLGLAAPDLAMLGTILVTVVLVTWKVFSLRTPVAGDDAYIAFRYARNLADGFGPVFNPGERIWGFTSPLHVLVLAGPAAIGADIPTLAVLLGIVANGVSAWLVFRLAARIVGRGGALVIGVLVLVSHVTFQYLSLETPLVGVLLWSFVTLACHDRPAFTGLVGALCCLARPDAVLLVAPILIAVPNLRRWRAWIAFAVPCVVWVAFSAAYYGDVLPNSLRVKFGGAPRGDYVRWIIGQFARWASEPFERPSPFIASQVLINLAILVVAAAGTTVLVRAAKLRVVRPLLIAIAVYPWTMLAAYIVMRPAIGHDWEYWNALAFNLVGVLVAIVLIFQRLRPREVAPGRGRLVIGIGLGVLAAAFAVGARGKLAQIAASDDAYWDGARYREYAAVAAWVNAHAPHANLFANEPGIIGYLTGDRVVSDGFLISPNPTTPPDLLLLPHAITEASSFGMHYHAIQAFPSQGFEPLTLLARDGWPPSR